MTPDLEAAARNALELLEDLFPTPSPNETTRDMAIWIACEKLRAALAPEAQPNDATVADRHRCPNCSENRLDWLFWIEGDYVRCHACGHEYMTEEE